MSKSGENLNTSIALDEFDDSIVFRINDKNVAVLKADGNALVHEQSVALDNTVYTSIKEWLSITHENAEDRLLAAEEESVRVAYVFDKLRDREALEQFESYLVNMYDALTDGAKPDDEPHVIYTFKVYRDQWELDEFKRGPNCRRVIDSFGNWLRGKHKWPPDSMSDVEFKIVEDIWEHWCNTLVDEDAVIE